VLRLQCLLRLQLVLASSKSSRMRLRNPAASAGLRSQVVAASVLAAGAFERRVRLVPHCGGSLLLPGVQKDAEAVAVEAEVAPRVASRAAVKCCQAFVAVGNLRLACSLHLLTPLVTLAPLAHWLELRLSALLADEAPYDSFCLAFAHIQRCCGVLSFARRLGPAAYCWIRGGFRASTGSGNASRPASCSSWLSALALALSAASSSSESTRVERGRTYEPPPGPVSSVLAATADECRALLLTLVAESFAAVLVEQFMEDSGVPRLLRILVIDCPPARPSCGGCLCEEHRPA